MIDTNKLSAKDNCLAALKKAPKGLTPTEAAKVIPLSSGNLSGALGQLYYAGLADRENIGRSEAVPTYRYMLNNPAKAARTKPAPKRRAKPAAKPEPEREEEPTNDFQALVEVAPDRVPAAFNPPLVPTLSLNQLLDTLASQIADQLIGRIVANVETRLAQSFQGQIESALTPTPPDVKPPKVAVVGLLAAQADIIRKKFDGRLNLSFPLKDNKTALKQASMFNVAVLTMTKFIGHHTESTLKAGGANIIRIAGGLSELELRLDSLCMTNA